MDILKGVVPKREWKREREEEAEKKIKKK